MVKISRDFKSDGLEPGDVETALKSAKATATTGNAALYLVPRRSIKVLDGFNVRAETTDYKAHQTDLKLSMQQHGWYRHKPLACYVVKDGLADVIYCVEGHTRLNAYDEATAEGKRLGPIPCVFEGKAKSIEDLTVQLAAANKSRGYGPIELAVIVHRLESYGQTTEEIAESIGKTDRYVRDLLFLQHKTPAPVRDMIAKGQIAAAEAIKVVKSHKGDKEAAITELRDIVEAAEAQGRSRATGKDIEGLRKSRAPREPAAEPVEAPARAAKPRPDVAAATDEDFLRAAIAYALAAPDTREWLSRWFGGEEDAVAELEAHMGQPLGATAKPGLRKPLDGAPAAEPEPEPPAPTEADGELFEDVAGAPTEAAETDDAPAKPKRDRRKKPAAAAEADAEMGGL
jgi:ParB-like chromosome segregation protein Spo0J